MEQGQECCGDWLEPRWQGIHALMVRLLGGCTCAASAARVRHLYTVEEVRSELRVTA